MMVTRKPVPSSTNPSNNPSSLPYPISPVSSNPHASFRTEENPNAMSSATNTEPNIWNEEGHSHPDPSSIPDSLRVGPSRAPPKPSDDVLKPNTSTTNPFLRRQQSQTSQNAVSDKNESSADIWNELTEKPTHPDYPPPPPPPVSQVTQQLSNMEVSGQNPNPWQPVTNERQAIQMTNLQREDSGNGAWSGANPQNIITPPESSEQSQQHVLVDIDEPESPAWDEDDYDEGDEEEEIPADSKKPVLPTDERHEILEGQHAWDSAHGEGSSQSSQTQTAVPVQPPGHNQYSSPSAEGWNLIDHDVILDNSQHSGVIGVDGMEVSTLPSEEVPPALPPRNARDHPPVQPPRPVADAANTATSSIMTPNMIASVQRQKKETYEVKKISWHDVNAEHNLRVSPILVQNANGPCPLLALVNALTLSTPAGVETALVETLRSRERVSLGLLLDAVFDELMSGRRGDAAQELPDVGDLYSFLLTLHTGMNVNPLFFPAEPMQSTNELPSSMSRAQRGTSLPGTFEETREMKLYGTFAVPLIHGWLPEEESPAYMALKRSARSYEDAQNLMFHEEVLEEKLSSEGLSFEEQGILEDISTIKAFLASAATQLTAHGLDLITKSLSPGAVAILFRNDHFSTIFRHPTTLQLLQLVTDSGYAGHEEVVWEGLIDVNGERAEFYSGDFRLVGGASTAPHGNEEASHSGPSRNQQESNNHEQGINTEQEDHDLALALQLQEEENERHRNETARRQRESELSQQYIEQQGNNSNDNNGSVSQRGGSGRGSTSGRGVNIPVRGSTRGSTQGRPAIPPRNSNIAIAPVDPEAGIDAPPPSYEQAATEPAYQPPTNHPAHPNANPSRRTSSYAATSDSQQRVPANMTGRRNNSTYGGRGRGGQTLIDQIPGRRIQNPNQLSTPQQQERQKDCVVM
ncbi:89e9a3c1-58ae-447a-8601-fa46a0fdb98a [Sclerotinia trifoliorum]|uniref:89e9a3c1-58ae-447a-8601-fa46a0fdb98a n=1 Tax=Sclerotinia trifoliorum TaxID=28548 RepID=A0A8H2VRM0_9HELO|nr:89e9a3c1-58ae-447a-8601-fa46a0fdb98a [Sclerotinia trifoliorum]